MNPDVVSVLDAALSDPTRLAKMTLGIAASHTLYERRQFELGATALERSSAARAVMLLPAVAKPHQHGLLSRWIGSGAVQFSDADVAPLPTLFARVATDQYSVEAWRLLFSRSGYLDGRFNFTATRADRPDAPITLWRAATAPRACGLHWGIRSTAMHTARLIFRGGWDPGDAGEPLALWRAVVPPEALWFHLARETGYVQWGLDPEAIEVDHVTDLELQ